MPTKEKKKPPFALFENIEPGEVIYQHGDPSKKYLVDSKNDVIAFVSNYRTATIPGGDRYALPQPIFDGMGWRREPSRYSKFAAWAEDKPLPTSMTQASQVMLERLKICSRMAFGGEIVENLNVRQTVDHITDRTIFSIETDVLIEKLTDREREVVFRYPASWWQFLKAQHAPAWFKKRFPVRFAEEKTRVRFKEVALYPQLPAVKPDCGQVIYQGMFDTDWSLEEPKKDYATIRVQVPKRAVP